MPVALSCPNAGCRQPLAVRPDVLGRRVRCRHCRHTFVAQSTEQAAPAARPATPPAAVGRFRVLAELGSGASGTVYKAHDPHLDREVAVKVPRAGVLDDPRAAERFLREARAAARLRHPSIVPVFEAGWADGLHFIASAYVPGRPLSAAVPAGGMGFDRAARIVRDLAEAAAHAHHRGIVHRDIKPQNVILDEGDRPHLLDFDLATRPAGGETITPAGAAVGTPAYMAPEQAAGGAADPAADQYSLGAVLYELLTGRVPFAGPPAVVVYHARHTEPPPPRAVRPDIPRDLEGICRKAMAKRAGDRYADCGEFADDLRRWAGGELTRARPGSAAGRAVRWARRRPGLAAVAAGLMLGGLSVVSLTLWRQAEAVRGQTPERVGADGDSPVTGLGAAIRSYRVGSADLHREVTTTLEQRRRQAAADGDAAQIEQLDRETAQFERGGELPSGATLGQVMKCRRLREELQAA